MAVPAVVDGGCCCGCCGCGGSGGDSVAAAGDGGGSVLGGNGALARMDIVAAGPASANRRGTWCSDFPLIWHIFFMDVHLAVHIHLSAQLQQCVHWHFAKDWQHCRLVGRIALHRPRWVARSAAARSAAALLSLAGTGVILRLLSPDTSAARTFCAVLRSTLSLGMCLASSSRIVGRHRRMQQTWEKRWPECCHAASSHHSGQGQLVFSAWCKGLFNRRIAILWQWSR